MQAQNIVSGKVINQDSKELIGVNISVKDIHGLGASTDFNGNYQISLPDGCNDLLFQYIGHEDVSLWTYIRKNVRRVATHCALDLSAGVVLRVESETTS